MLLFALSFVPYFLPDDQKPAFFRDDRYQDGGDASSASGLAEPEQLAAASSKVDAKDVYVSRSLDALFSQEELPSRTKKR